MSGAREKAAQLQVEKEKALADLKNIRKINRTMEKSVAGPQYVNAVCHSMYCLYRKLSETGKQETEVGVLVDIPACMRFVSTTKCWHGLLSSIYISLPPPFSPYFLAPLSLSSHSLPQCQMEGWRRCPDNCNWCRKRGQSQYNCTVQHSILHVLSVGTS